MNFTLRTLVWISSSQTAAVIHKASDGDVPRPNSSMITKLLFVTCCNKYAVSLISDMKEEVPISVNVLSLASLESNYVDFFFSNYILGNI